MPDRGSAWHDSGVVGRSLRASVLVLGALGSVATNRFEPSLPTSETCTDEGWRGVLGALEVGPDGPGAFEPWREGDSVEVSVGGQGAPMIAARLRVTGPSLPACLPQATRLLDGAGVEAGGDANALRLVEPSAGAMVSGTLLMIFYGGPEPDALYRWTTSAGGLDVELTLEADSWGELVIAAQPAPRADAGPR